MSSPPVSPSMRPVHPTFEPNRSPPSSQPAAPRKFEQHAQLFGGILSSGIDPTDDYESFPCDEDLRPETCLQHRNNVGSHDTSPTTTLSAPTAEINTNRSRKTTQLPNDNEPAAAGSDTTLYISDRRVISRQITSLGGPLSALDVRVHGPVGENKETPHPQSLPSLRYTLGGLRNLATEHLPEQDLAHVPLGPSTTFSTSPTGNIGHRFSVSTLPSSAHSPPKDYSTPFSRSALSASTHGYTTSSTHPCARTEYQSSNSGETPSTDLSASEPTTSTSINSVSPMGRMSVDNNTHPQPISGSYRCRVQGCNAAPFQTQYLFNSHMNVHSSARPHYCPVKGCPRSEGGKGFKRKNEMIRHGLVHDSPGYVCPFCPDREHKYPRPDNLQRHVRVHHVDKDKDDPQIRDVLAQRPDGPNRGRRRRGPPS